MKILKPVKLLSAMLQIYNLPEYSILFYDHQLSVIYLSHNVFHYHTFHNSHFLYFKNVYCFVYDHLLFFESMISCIPNVHIV